MVARCRTVAFQGIEVMPVDVQVQLSNGLPAFSVVGLPDKAVAKAASRCAARWAPSVSLCRPNASPSIWPGDLPKEGSHFDMPIALALLAAMGVLPPDGLEEFVALGELGLDGAIGSVNGILPAAIAAHSEDRGLICPAAQGGEAAWPGDAARVLAAPSLLSLINHFKGAQVLSPPVARMADEDGATGPDLRDIKGQETAKRALEIAAAGAHNLLLLYPDNQFRYVAITQVGTDAGSRIFVHPDEHGSAASW